MFEKLVSKLRAIPALGVIKEIEHLAGGVVPRLYLYKAVLVNYDGIEQVLAFTPSEWDDCISRSDKHGFTASAASKELFATVEKITYTANIRKKLTTCDAYLLKVIHEGIYYYLMMRPSDLKQAVDLGIRAERMTKMRCGKFKKFIRKIGLFIFG